MSHLRAEFGGADTYSTAQRYSFDDQGNVTNQTSISGLGAEMSADLGSAPEINNDYGMNLG
ncbi:MAG: hypothetical protein GW778_04860 [Alphaproteobacteria bacterium]|nr:hypothetical protein [Alphaproteobacteria bacterium]